ncbi:uncharacterized protein Z518_04040 [Rhinocladiella mackenziei CBS 650.93]|uniref:CHY-type domain-containing protein n=1 Tax=Rhinocladiella mackenziei CBS 650.93 TaxID=1442369 RepID=A0A0D2ISG3_9EURO|nr:uncharacterized protein Z518_04040 [Rhinocladiella mackenziei CBS 650.93]KIX06066.1 hypothetical protein Z518_04040 [Rhinocladiella mackenziei CBS 650.93]
MIHRVVVGCRAGSQCPYRHVQPNRQKQGHQQTEDVTGSAERRTLSHSPSQKPISQPQQTSPREFQIGQVIRRFAPVRKEIDDATVLSFTLNPSDPDFPFELEGLLCTLKVPQSYPQNGRPRIRVTNAEMARGYQINIEKGFDSLVEQSPRKALLALLNDLDKNLEKFLTLEKARTVKIIANAEKGVKEAEPATKEGPISAPEPIIPIPLQPSWTPHQRADALAKRQADIRQLTARMGRASNFSSGADGITFNVPVKIAQPDRLPLPLQSLKDVVLKVPNLYNLEPCTVQLQGMSGSEVENVQRAFEWHVREHPEMTLMAHVNFLAQNIHSMTSKMVGKAAPQPELIEAQHDVSEESMAATKGDLVESEERKILDEEHPHVKVIPRPPEWGHHDSDSEYGSDSEYDSDGQTHSEDDEEEDGADQGGAALPASSTSSANGILLSFPNLELHNIELLTLTTLSVSVRCLRCKSPLDVSNIRPSNASSSNPGIASSIRTESCPKCTTPFTISFVSSPLHTNTIRAGTLDITGCTITDLLPSVFQPTCSSCSNTFPSPPGMISVRGDSSIQVCRSCHAKMTFAIPEVKFLRLSHAVAPLPLRRPKKDTLGISAGTPLPLNGTCPHYRHSYRWFRFGCCGRVHACDRCHDAAEAHVNERADRMICGWCSREQRFRPQDCALCGKRLVRRRKATGGFWEGGKGTRDKGLMSRKEKRKYKRSSGGNVIGGSATGKKG